MLYRRQIEYNLSYVDSSVSHLQTRGRSEVQGAIPVECHDGPHALHSLFLLDRLLFYILL